jgi:putative transposase
MVLRQAYKYRLNTKPVDELLMKQISGCCRFVWNKALAFQKERLDDGERTLSYNKLAVLLPSWKKEHLFLNDAPSQALQQVLKNLDRAIKWLRQEATGEAVPYLQEEVCGHRFIQVPAGFQD